MTIRKNIFALTGSLMGMLLSISIAAEELRKQTVVFGYVENGLPVSNFDNETVGFCGEVSVFLQTKYNLISKQLRADQRFDKFANLEIAGVNHDVVRVQCGPDSKTESREKILKTVNGFFSRTFAKTSIKLLIRNDAIDTAADNVEKLRIGVISTAQYNSDSTDDNSLMAEVDPVNTTATIKNVFPNSSIKQLINREDAITQLRNKTIDAYASDEILLSHILTENLRGEKESYSLYPAAHGYSNEEYALSVYNDQPNSDQGTVLLVLNDWLANAPEAKAAEIKLQPASDWMVSALQWLNRKDHLSAVRITFFISLAAMLLITGLVALRRFLPLHRSSRSIDITHQSELQKVQKMQKMQNDASENIASEHTINQESDSLKDTNSTETEELAIQKLSNQLQLWLGEVKLSETEKEVFRLWNPVVAIEVSPVEGSSTKKIGWEMHGENCTEAMITTIRSHITNIKKKFRGSNLTPAILEAWSLVHVYTDPKKITRSMLHTWVEKHDSNIQNDNVPTF